MEWQLIDSAPRDGTWIMIGYYPEYMDGNQQGGHPEIAWWNNSNRCWCNGHVYLNGEGVFSPTHWMPIPNPPNNSIKEVKK